MMVSNSRAIKLKKRSPSDGVTVDTISASSNKTHRSKLTRLDTSMAFWTRLTGKKRAANEIVDDFLMGQHSDTVLVSRH